MMLTDFLQVNTLQWLRQRLVIELSIHNELVVLMFITINMLRHL